MNAKTLSNAVRNGDLAEVKRLIALGIDVNEIDVEQAWPPLHLAIEQGAIAIVEVLIAAGADVNRSLENDWTPLAHAVDIESDAAWQSGLQPDHTSTELMTLLLASGAIPSKRAIEIARAYENQKATVLLEAAQRAAQ